MSICSIAVGTVGGLADELAASYLETYQVPGLGLGVMLDGQVIWRAGYGDACLDTDSRVTPLTLFHMASVTKPLVATAVMQLVESGKVDLDQPFATLVPSFSIADSRGRTITVRHLLTHTSGLPDVESYQWDHPEFDDGALERYVHSLAGVRLLSVPGTRFAYSDIGFDILGALIARISGVPFEQYVAQQVLAPAGMKSSSLLIREVNRSLLAFPHRLDEHGNTKVLPEFPYNRRHAGSSTLYSNVDDMLRWCAVNLGNGELEGRRILRAETLAAMWNGSIGDVHPAIPRNGRVGLCWFIFSRRGQRLVGHMGQDEGFASLLLLMPERGLAMVSMANRSHDYAQQGLWDLQFKLMDRLA
jgi:CubicO group peptidase (beta-lactamase class C family)